MSERKLFGLFTGGHLTVMFCAAVLAPGAVYAVAASSVAITDPATGHQAAVDAGRRVYVYDPIAGYANSPLNFVRFAAFCDASGSTFNYTPPAGDALVVKAADFTFWNGASGNDNFVYLSSTGGFIAGLNSLDAENFKSSYLGNGFYVRNGEHLVVSCSSDGLFSNVSIEGYLIPNGAAPPSAAAEVADPRVRNGKPL